jgi:hypothetical protein
LFTRDRLQKAFREILINHKRVYAATWLSAAKFRGEAKPSVSERGFFCCSRAFVPGFAIPPQLLRINLKMAGASSKLCHLSKRPDALRLFDTRNG